jgi:hypothetical protein
MKALDIHVPLATLVSRFEKQRDQLRGDLRTRLDLSDAHVSMLSAAISVYEIEIEAALRLGGATQMAAMRREA